MSINFYDRFFYSFYSLLGKIGDYDLGFKSVMLMSFLMFIQIVAVLFILFERSNLEWINSLPGVSIISAPILIFNYLYFIRSKRYKHISSVLGKQGKQISSFLGVVYIIGTFVFLLISAVPS